MHVNERSDCAEGRASVGSNDHAVNDSFDALLALAVRVRDGDADADGNEDRRPDDEDRGDCIDGALEYVLKATVT